jgi:hypothetical protein
MQIYIQNKYSQNLFRLILNKFFTILIYKYLYSISRLKFQYRTTKKTLSNQQQTNQNHSFERFFYVLVLNNS